jgi:uncharacterized protein (TIRG00374 family)
MKKHLSLILRIAVAVVGVAIIGWSLDWTDKVDVRGDFDCPYNHTRLSKGLYRIVEGDVNPKADWLDVKVVPVKDTAAAPTAIRLPLRKADGAATAPAAQTQPARAARQTAGPPLHYANHAWLVVAFLLVGPIYPIIAVRWWMLLKARGLEVARWKAFRLSLVGAFFNYCMPGSTGGDLVKAYYAARYSDRRADAVMTVVFDRIVGLLALVLMAGLAGLFMLHDPVAGPITRYVWVVIGGVIVASAVYFSHRVRSRLGLDWLLSRLKPESLPAKFDRAAVAYRDHKMVVFTTVLMSVPVQILVGLSTALTAYALDMQTPLFMLLMVVPLLFLVGAIPISYQGFGIMEGVALALLSRPGLATANQVVVMLLLARVYQVLYSLLGSVFLLQGDIHMRPKSDDEAPVPASQAAQAHG